MSLMRIDARDDVRVYSWNDVRIDTGDDMRIDARDDVRVYSWNDEVHRGHVSYHCDRAERGQ